MTDDGARDAFLSADHPEIPDVEPTRTRPIGDDPPSEVVVRTVADVLDRDPLDLPPLHEALDPDALDDLFEDLQSGGGRHGRFAFEYCGCTVALLGSDQVAVDANE